MVRFCHLVREGPTKHRSRNSPNRNILQEQYFRQGLLQDRKQWFLWSAVAVMGKEWLLALLLVVAVSLWMPIELAMEC